MTHTQVISDAVSEKRNRGKGEVLLCHLVSGPKVRAPGVKLRCPWPAGHKGRTTEVGTGCLDCHWAAGHEGRATEVGTGCLDCHWAAGHGSRANEVLTEYLDCPWTAGHEDKATMECLNGIRHKIALAVTKILGLTEFILESEMVTFVI